LNIIKQELPPKLDLHCFSGSYDILKEYLKLPIETHIGIGGVCTFKNARVIKEVIDNTDIDVFLTETDCPYLAPTPHRGETNEPMYIPLIIHQIAAQKNLTDEEAADLLYENGKKFYGIN
jgi:TatD DNase family protein